MNGIGIGALPGAFVTQAVGQGRDVRILPEWCLPELSVWFLMSTRRHLPAKTRSFIDHVIEFWPFNLIQIVFDLNGY
ncbi:MAG: hypothetical protein KGI54_07455 [Pseudomonadota bacterium]|nr:hypothetical protein [Pseudomonadota bacterium]